MPSVPNLGFSVQFDLTAVPTLRITDTSSHNLIRTASFDIKQPDLYTRVGNIESPDLAAGVNVFTIPLRLDSLGLPQCGTYVITMTTRSLGYEDTLFTRQWVSEYKPVTINIGENFDVFTPNLSVRDNTSYSSSNYNYGSITRSWSITSTPTGTLTGSSVTKSLVFGGSYYDANYSISLTSSLLYTHQVYSWFSVNETLSKNYNTYAQTPEILTDLVASISELKTKLDDAINKCLEYTKLKADFEYAQSLFIHIIDRLKTGDTYNIFKDLKDLLAVLNGYQIPLYVPTNLPIPPYDLTAYFPGAIWGAITGDITNQTDLWTIIQDLYVRDHYTHNQPIASSTWTVVHNMGKNPSLVIVDSSGDEVLGEVTHVSENQLIISFTASFSGIAYLN